MVSFYFTRNTNICKHKFYFWTLKPWRKGSSTRLTGMQGGWITAIIGIDEVEPRCIFLFRQQENAALARLHRGRSAGHKAAHQFFKAGPRQIDIIQHAFAQFVGVVMHGIQFAGIAIA